MEFFVGEALQQASSGTGSTGGVKVRRKCSARRWAYDVGRRGQGSASVRSRPCHRRAETPNQPLHRRRVRAEYPIVVISNSTPFRHGGWARVCTRATCGSAAGTGGASTVRSLLGVAAEAPGTARGHALRSQRRVHDQPLHVQRQDPRARCPAVRSSLCNASNTRRKSPKRFTPRCVRCSARCARRATGRARPRRSLLGKTS